MNKKTILLILQLCILVPFIIFLLLYPYKDDVRVHENHQSPLSFQEALAYCHEENASLPSISEAQKLYRHSAFRDNTDSYYWLAEITDNLPIGKGNLINVLDGKIYNNEQWVSHGVLCIQPDPKRAYIQIAALILSLFVLVNLVRYYRQANLIGASFLSGRYFNATIVLSLTCIWLFFALYKIGSNTAPQTFFESSKSNEVILEFNKQVHIQRICFYNGIDKQGKFRIEQYSEDKKTWSPFFDKGSDAFPFSFKWNCSSVNALTTKTKLHFSEQPVMLGELRFLNPYGNPINNFLIKQNDEKKLFNINKLFDELNTTHPITGYEGGFYFDEIYHARSGYELLHDLQPYDVVHPMLGKYIISQGIKLFDMTPFGYRITNVFFGALFIIVAYYFGLKLFRSRIYATLGAMLFTYSFMHLTQARIGLIDTFGVFFTMSYFYFLYIGITKLKKKSGIQYFFVSALFAGLAISVKWSSLFGFVGVGFIIFYLSILNSQGKFELHPDYTKYRLTIYAFLIYATIPLLIYFAHFYVILDMNFEQFLQHQLNILHYHDGLKSIHSFSSPWYSWILDYKPMGYFKEDFGDMTSSIVAMGHPLIFGALLSLLSISFLKSKISKPFFCYWLSVHCTFPMLLSIE